jgi:pimeloyl-ACP methyl ester carboxylesterase
MKTCLSKFCVFLLTFSTIFCNLHAEEEAFDPAVLAEEGGAVLKAFEHWFKHRVHNLEKGSKIAETEFGPIEYVKYGFGPVVLCLHGAPGGYDQSFLIGANLVEQGFTVIGVSRPGYLRTPLAVGQTIEQQADAMVGLLDALEIEQAAVLGFSAGGPVAFQMMLRHPDRVWAGVLESIGSPTAYSTLYQLVLNLIKYPQFGDFGSWLLYLALGHNFKSTASGILAIDNSLELKELDGRVDYVLHNKCQSRFLKNLIMSILPVEPRIEGLTNDIMNLDPWPTFPYQQIATPTIIVQSSADRNGSYPEAQFVAESISGAELITVEDSGHFIWLGKEAKYWEKQVAQFLHNNEP